MQINYLALLFLVHFSQGIERKLNWTLNPGCQTCNTTLLVHVIADGPADTIHYIWGFVGRPTLLFAVTEPSVNLTINWTNLLSNRFTDSVKFDSIPIYSFGIALSRVLEFQDLNDTADLAKSESVLFLPAENFDWTLTQPELDADGSLVLEVQALVDKDDPDSGSIFMTVSGYAAYGHGAQLPHLLHTANCSQLEVTMQGLKTRFGATSRFALELLVAGSETMGRAQVSQHRSLDDEHTPGVFTVAELLTPKSRSGQLGGFVQWRPVVYTLPKREIETSTEARHYNVTKVPMSEFNNSLLLAFYGTELKTVMAQAFNVSFGVSEDGFYSATNYTTWTLSVGYGQPPEEHLSLLVMMIMGVGLGVPSLLMLSGGLYMLLKRPAKKDDLFLNR